MKVKGLLLDVYSNSAEVKVVEIDEDILDEFYEALSCRCIDIVVRKVGDLVFNIVCDDEGLFRDDPNISAISSDGQAMLVGNLFICNNFGEHLTSLSEEEIVYLHEHMSCAIKVNHKGIHCMHPVLRDVDYV